MQHELIVVCAPQRFDPGCIPQRAQGRHDDGLRLASGEHCRAVRSRQQAHLDVDGPNRIQVATVDTRLTSEDAFPHEVFFQVGEAVADVAWFNLFAGDLLDGLGAQRADAGLSSLLVGSAVRLAEFRAHLGLETIEERAVFRRRLPLPFRFAGLSDKCIDCLDRHLHFHVREDHTAEHLVFRQFLRFGLHHEHGRFGTGHDHVEQGSLQRFMTRIQHVRAIHESDPGRADGTRKGYA